MRWKLPPVIWAMVAIADGLSEVIAGAGPAGAALLTPVAQLLLELPSSGGAGLLELIKRAAAATAS